MKLKVELQSSSNSLMNHFLKNVLNVVLKTIVTNAVGVVVDNINIVKKLNLKKAKQKLKKLLL